MNGIKSVIVLVFALFVSMALPAQESDFQRTVARFKTCKQAAANVIKRQHLASTGRDIVTTGGAFLLRPDMVSISTNEGMDKLVMQGTKFSVTVDGREHIIDSRKNAQFTTLQRVVSSVINGGDTDITKLPGVTVKKTGSSISITILPPTIKNKRKKDVKYSSFVLVFDMKTSVQTLLRMVESDGSFTDYEFSKFVFE